MNGEIPSVPVTTLAGISSLTDLLPEMPLPSPMLQTLNNKSLLFHPRVAEEANILLSQPDENLIPQLINSLNQTPPLNIELKAQYAAEAPHSSKNEPALLKAILFKESFIFDGFGREKANSSVIVNASTNKKIEEFHDEHFKSASTPKAKEVFNDSSVPDLFRSLGSANASELLSPSKDAFLSQLTSELTGLKSPALPLSETESLLSSSLGVSSVLPKDGALFDREPSTPSGTPSNSQVANQKVNKSPSLDEKSPSVKESPARKSEETKRTKANKNAVVFSKMSTRDEELMQKSLSVYLEKSQLKNHVSTDGSVEKIEEPIIKEEEPEDKKQVTPTKSEDESNERHKRRKRLCRSSETKSENNSSNAKNASDDEAPKTKVRKIGRNLVPVIKKLNVEELMETNTYQRFNRTIDQILDEVDVIEDSDGQEDDCPSEALLSKYQLQDLCSEAAKLKTLGAMESIPTVRTVRLLTVLEKNIRDGIKVSPVSDPNDGEDERKLFVELAMERVMRAVDASLTALYILTSPNMHKQVYLEDVIDKIIVYTKFQLQNTIYPAFDPVYRVENKDGETVLGSGRKKRGHFKEVREKNLLNLYNKLSEVVLLLSELLDIQRLTDNSVLHATSMGISPFFVEGVSDLQLSALKLVTTIFMKYEKHRKLLLDDILASMARLPSSKRSLRSFRLNGEEYIQMLTALVLQLVHCMVVLPCNLDSKEREAGSHPDIIIVSKFKAARSTASTFLYAFLSKCSGKNEEIDYRPIFENFVHDLLTTVNKPEWPAAELLLSVLGNLLVNKFVNKSLEISLRVASLDYLGVVAARLRKDTVSSASKLSKIDQLIKEIKSEEIKEEDKVKDDLDSEEGRTKFLQRMLLDYLAMRGQTEPLLNHARHFYLAQWYQDCCVQPNSPAPNKKAKKKKKRRKDESEEESDSEPEEESKQAATGDQVENMKINESQKKFLISKIRPFEDKGTGESVLQTYIDYDSAELVARYLASRRPFSQSFNQYLKQILNVLTETSVLIRTKAMKCLTSIVEVDPSVLGLNEMQLGVQHSFFDYSTSVREAAVDLVGKYILSRPELIARYYDMLSSRILDTGVSVRKRVIKILKDVCVECPDFPKIPEICVKIIRRVNDEEGIRKLVLEVFQNMWFTPVKDKPVIDSDALVRKVMNITDVIACCNELSIEWFEQLLVSLFKPQDDKDKEETGPSKQVQEVPRSILLASKQIVDCLVEMILRLDGLDNSSQRLVSCHSMLYLFAKIHPQLLVHHASTLQPYLSLKCQTHEDYQIISCVARSLELVVPLIEHPSEMFLSRLEEDSVKLMMQQDPAVVSSCVSCLGSIVNNVTRNFALIRDCLKKYYGFLKKYKTMMDSGALADAGPSWRPPFRRSMYVVGLLLRFFDFTDKDVLGDQLPETIKNDIFDTLMYFLLHDKYSQNYILKSIGQICIRYYDLMLGKDLKELYHKLLIEIDAPLQMKTQVLTNIELYLQEEERRMIKLDQEWAKLSKQENLKEMGDVSSGMASTVIQVYLKQILESFLHSHVNVRTAALKVIQLILAQGLVHPVAIVPYLICMSSDDDRQVAHSADKQLQDIEKKYPGFIHMKAKAGIRLAFQLQKIIQTSDIVRGFRTKEGEMPTALNGFLYSALRTKQQKRALIMSILKHFDEQVKTSLSFMLYLADNMAYFPFQVQDEPLFIIHHIDIMISVTGTNLLQSFRESLIPVQREVGQNEDDEEDEDEETLLSRVPENTTPLHEILIASQGCLLLLVLKQHLKSLYGFNDAKITQYSPSESAKVYEKPVNRKTNSRFNPKATLQKLKEGTPPSVLDDDARRALISEYLEFKTLIMNLDPDDVDDGDDGPQNQSSEGAALRVREVIAKKVAQESESRAARELEASQPKIPKLTIIASKGEVRQHRTSKTRKAERHKKHHRRKRKHKSSDESDNEYSDPDYV